MAGNGDEEEVSLIGIQSPESALPNVLEEIALAGILPGELPRGLVESVGISIWIYVDLEIGLHVGEIQPENLGRMVNIGELLVVVINGAGGGGGGGGGGVDVIFGVSGGKQVVVVERREGMGAEEGGGVEGEVGEGKES